MEKASKSTNVLRIYDRLKQSPVTIEVLHKWVKENGIRISRRTLYRYLNNLADSVRFNGEKLTLNANESNKKVWNIEPESKPKPNNELRFLSMVTPLPPPQMADAATATLDFEIEFSPVWAQAVSQIVFQKNQKIRFTEKGALVVTFRGVLSNGLIGLMLYFQTEVVVHKPARLKQLMVQKLRAMLAGYS